MYKDTSQFTIDDFIFPFGTLDPDNRWVRLSLLVPWDDIERGYAKQFGTTGAPAHPARMAFGALLLKQILDVSDAELVFQIAENPYLQFFIGMHAFVQGCPFGTSTLVAFRKRFSADEVTRIDDIVCKQARERQRAEKTNGTEGHDDGNEDGGTLVMDATVAPANIAYPQDIRLLSEAREKLERMIDVLCAQTGAKKPRMRRNVARKDFLNWSKSKRRSAKVTRRARRAQLGYISRDLGFLQTLIEEHHAEPTDKQLRDLDIIGKLSVQQKEMHDTHTRRCERRVVSLEQPWVRPIVRGKTHANTEFGAKVHLCIEDGLSRVDHASFEAYNEAVLLIPATESYRVRCGCYPKRILADKIYMNRENRKWCKERGIELAGPRLGRPPKDLKAAAEARRLERDAAGERNCVEGAFGTMKHSYGMGRVMARLKETSETVVALAVLSFNLKKLMRLLCAFVHWLLERLTWAAGTLAPLCSMKHA